MSSTLQGHNSARDCGVGSPALGHFVVQMCTRTPLPAEALQSNKGMINTVQVVLMAAQD